MLRRRDTDISTLEGIWALFPDAFDLEGTVTESKVASIAAEFDPSRTRARTYASMKASATKRPDQVVVYAEYSFDKDYVRPPLSKTINFPAGLEGDSRPGPTPLCPTFSLGSGTYGKLYADGLLSATQRGFKDVLLRLLQAVDNDIQDVATVQGYGGRSTVVLGYPRDASQPMRWVDLSCVGDGVRRVLALGISLIRASRGILFVDDLENSLCPASTANTMSPVISTFLQIADQLQTQIIATNSLELIDSVASHLDVPGRANDLTLHRLWIENTSGPPKVRSYDQGLVLRLRERALDIR
jgi:hypothetical protein